MPHFATEPVPARIPATASPPTAEMNLSLVQPYLAPVLLTHVLACGFTDRRTGLDLDGDPSKGRGADCIPELRRLRDTRSTCSR
ncbi:hypothetical protein ADL12_27285 [Streptomyces regalis]|uniref:Uncharacterized protein n=1 Tax=Streptomyces regalis TaxID=68262 RepID=A0A101JNU4_9ACTN|nr:hypothetical protein ADL12_27285 [Streptomyces regalis]